MEPSLDNQLWDLNVLENSLLMLFNSIFLLLWFSSDVFFDILNVGVDVVFDLMRNVLGWMHESDFAFLAKACSLFFVRLILRKTGDKRK